MVDPKLDKQENFVINEKFGDDEEEDDFGRENYYQDHADTFPKKYFTPYTIGGVGLAVIVILFIIFLAGPENTVDSKQLDAIEARIQQLEKRLPPADIMNQTLDQLGRQEERLNAINERFDRFNTTVSAQVNQIIKELSALQQTSTPASASPSEDSGQEKAQPRIHEVRPEETLWGISRQYGLTLEQLRSYNKIGPKATIQPGQKLKLTPN